MGRLACRQCSFASNSGQEGMQHVLTNDGHVVHGPGKGKDTEITIERLSDGYDI